jgi:hypothetical protein
VEKLGLGWISPRTLYIKRRISSISNLENISTELRTLRTCVICECICQSGRAVSRELWGRSADQRELHHKTPNKREMCR